MGAEMTVGLFGEEDTQGSNSRRMVIEHKLLLIVRRMYRKGENLGLTCRIRRCLNCVQQLHCLDIIEINLVF